MNGTPDWPDFTGLQTVARTYCERACARLDAEWAALPVKCKSDDASRVVQRVEVLSLAITAATLGDYGPLDEHSRLNTQVAKLPPSKSRRVRA